MASIYQRPDSKNFCLSCYPRPGAKLLRASLGTENEAEAEKVARTVELLIELEKYSDTKVPEKLLECLIVVAHPSENECFRMPGTSGCQGLPASKRCPHPLGIKPWLLVWCCGFPW